METTFFITASAHLKKFPSEGVICGMSGHENIRLMGMLGPDGGGAKGTISGYQLISNIDLSGREFGGIDGRWRREAGSFEK